MAKAFQSMSKDTYLSGLWESDLKRGLLWYPRNQRETSRPPGEQPLGPSWSWTSLISPRGVSYEFITGATPDVFSSSCSSIISAEASVVGVNQFGRVERAELRGGFLREINMPLVPDTKMDDSLAGWRIYCSEFPELKMRFLIDMKVEVAVGTKVVLFPLSIFQLEPKRAVGNDETSQDSQDWEGFQKVVADTSKINCLLLVPADSNSSIYKRVGVVQTAALYCFHGCRREQFTII